MYRKKYFSPRIWVLIFASWVFTSCTPPLPVYFDAPLGVKVQGFDTLIAGNYIPLDDVIEKGTKEFREKYKVKYDKIIPAGTDTARGGIETTYEAVKDILGTKKDSAKAGEALSCDSIFNSFCAFNPLAVVKLSSALEREGKAKPGAAMLKIAYDRIFYIKADSLGNNIRDTLLSLSESVRLTKYAEKYFLNFKTPFGWEIMQLEIWENKFLSLRPFYFTGYNYCAKDAAELTASTRNIYPNLTPVLNPAKKVIGFRAALNPKMVMDKFSRSEAVVMLLKIG